MNSIAIKTFASINENQKEPYGPILYGPGASKRQVPYTLRVLEVGEKEALAKAKKYAMEQSIQCVLQKQSVQFQSPAIISLKKQQTLTMLNRIYVGSVNYDVTDAYIRDHFIVYGPIKTITMSWEGGTTRHKGYGFVEFEFPESAILSIEQSNGLQFHGRIMKVGRPTNLPDPAPHIKQFIEEHNLKRRIFIIGVHSALNDVDIEQVFGAFGKITRCKLETEISDPTAHRGLGYIDYETEQSASQAVHSMNQFELGGKLLRCTKAICPPEFIKSFQNQAEPVQFPLQNIEPLAEPPVSVIRPVPPPTTDIIEIQPNNQDGIPHFLPYSEQGVLMLLNMAELEEVDSELAEEVREECENFGLVNDVKIIPINDQVRIFVLYESSMSVDAAISSLDGRFFSGRKVIAARYNLAAFLSGNLDI